jgi:TPR repeat protein
MKLIKKILTAILGLQLVGCASSVNEKTYKHYVCESEFKSEYNEAKKHLKNGIYVKALSLLNKLEEENYAPALYTLYEVYDKAEGVKEDKAKAFSYLNRAYLNQYPVAEYKMAEKMLKGEEVEKDSEEAIKILKDLAERKYGESGQEHIFYRLKAKANILVARAYFEGEYIAQDLKQAGEYGYIIGSLPPTQEYNIGRELLGEAYFLYGKIMIAQSNAGLEVSWNLTTVFRHAQEMGVIEVDYEEGLLYLEENNFEYAASSFGLGCSSGHAESCYEAGVLYEENKVYKNGDKDEYGHVRKNPLLIASRYYTEGEKLGNVKCKERLKVLKSLK